MEELRFDSEIFIQSKIEKEFKLREIRRELQMKTEEIMSLEANIGNMKEYDLKKIEEL